MRQALAISISLISVRPSSSCWTGSMSFSAENNGDRVFYLFDFWCVIIHPLALSCGLCLLARLALLMLESVLVQVQSCYFVLYPLLLLYRRFSSWSTGIHGCVSAVVFDCVVVGQQNLFCSRRRALQIFLTWRPWSLRLATSCSWRRERKYSNIERRHYFESAVYKLCAQLFLSAEAELFLSLQKSKFALFSLSYFCASPCCWSLRLRCAFVSWSGLARLCSRLVLKTNLALAVVRLLCFLIHFIHGGTVQAPKWSPTGPEMIPR